MTNTDSPDDSANAQPPRELAQSSPSKEETLDELDKHLIRHVQMYHTSRSDLKQALTAYIDTKVLEARIEELQYISPAVRRDKDGKLLGSVGGRLKELEEQTNG